MDENLTGKVFLITGATEGIGKAAARSLAQRGAEVVVVGRDRAKTERVVSELGAEARGGHVSSIIAELSRVSGALAVAREFASNHERLDVLINNAGAIFDERRLNPDGIEMTFALNHLAYFALTTRLLPLLTKTPGARVVSTSSGAYSMGRIELPEVTRCEKKYSMFKAYGDSKLANVLFTRELARREREKVIASCYFPGFVRTHFGAEARGLLNGIIQALAPYVARTPEKGAETMLWLATSPEAAQLSGEYVQDKKAQKTNAHARNDESARQLWDFCEDIVAGVEAA